MKFLENQSFGSLCEFLNGLSITNESEVHLPFYDVIENDSEIQIDLSLAGISKNNISIDTEKNTLIIKAERIKNDDVKYVKIQTYFGKYFKSFIIPDSIDKQNISSSLNNGILSIKLPKIKFEKSIDKKSIEIK